MEGLLGAFLLAVLIGFIGWAVASIVPFLRPSRDQIGVGLFAIVLVIWLLQHFFPASL